MKILAVTEPDWYGVRRALESITPYYASPADALLLLTDSWSRPDAVVFGCYRPEWEAVRQAAIKLKCQLVLIWFASYVLNEFDKRNRDWLAMGLEMARMGIFQHVATPHEGLALNWTHYGIPTYVLPLVVEDMEVENPSIHGIRLGILGSGQPWKNVDCQIAAAGMIPEATIHVQGPHRKMADLLHIPVVYHPHEPNRNRYLSLIASMTVNLCVSMSEVYSYLCAESLLLGVPVVTGQLTPVLWDSHDVLRICRTPYYDDPVEIAERIRQVLAQRDHIREVGREHMLKLNAHNRAKLDTLLQSWHLV